jgi:hypothetical protein
MPRSCRLSCMNAASMSYPAELAGLVLSGFARGDI